MSIAAISVSQLNRYVKSLMDTDENLNGIYVSGEISNFTNHYKSGHLYFSLKDDNAAIKAVMFSSYAMKLRFMPADGMQVIARGRVSIYEGTGQYQFYADSMQPDGLGALNLAFEQLKEKLSKEGLFDEKRKKPLPKYPMRIGVITSPSGAAVRDILQITKRRWPIAKIIMCPVLVQGEGAARSLCRAVELMNEKNAADVIIIGRGGGSLEDLFAFNDETLCRTVANSKVPVISAVGHETDFTICDFVADVRAPTPSAAAELATPDRDELLSFLSGENEYLKTILKKRISDEKNKLGSFLRAGVMKRPLDIVSERRLLTDNITMRFENAAKKMFQDEYSKLSLLCGKIDALSPLKVIARGYTITNKGNERIDSAANLRKGDHISVLFKDGSADCLVETINTKE